MLMKILQCSGSSTPYSEVRPAPNSRCQLSGWNTSSSPAAYELGLCFVVGVFGAGEAEVAGSRAKTILEGFMAMLDAAKNQAA